MALLLLGKDISGNVDYSLPAPTSCYDVVLPANTVKTITTPSNYNRAFFSFAAGTNVWVTFDGSNPVIPVADGVSKQELNPTIRQIPVGGGNTIKFISNEASFVNVRYDLGQTGSNNV